MLKGSDVVLTFCVIWIRDLEICNTNAANEKGYQAGSGRLRTDHEQVLSVTEAIHLA